jgi:hypothetical protein
MHRVGFRTDSHIQLKNVIRNHSVGMKAAVLDFQRRCGKKVAYFASSFLFTGNL